MDFKEIESNVGIDDKGIQVISVIIVSILFLLPACAILKYQVIPKLLSFYY